MGQAGGAALPTLLVSLDDIRASLAPDMLGIADQLGLERLVASGVSLGCATALYAALEAPQRGTEQL